MTSTTTGTVFDHVDSPPFASTRWAGPRTFWLVALGLLVLLAALIPVMDTGSIAVPDDGVYAAQADLLAHGSWSERRPAVRLDDDGAHSVIGPDLTYRDRQIPYLKHPLFPTALGRFYAVGGFAGLLAFSVLGTWLASIAAGLMARRLDSRYGIPALLLAGLGTPLVFDAYLVSAHSMAAALCGFVVLGLAACVEDRRWWSLLYVLPSAALVIGLRSEGAVAMAAAAAIVGLFAVRLRPIRIDWSSVAAAACVLVTAAAAYLADARWARSITAATGAAGAGRPRGIPADRDPLGVVWISLIRPGETRAGSVMPAVVLALAATVLAAVAVKVAPRRWLLPVVLVTVSAVALVAQQFSASWLVTGLAATFPLLPAGIILLHREDLRLPMVARNLAIALLATIVITVTTYSGGGAAEWGGRFYHLLIPLLVPVVVLGLHRGASALEPRPAQVIGVAVVVATLLLSVLGLRYIASSRERFRATTEATARFVAGVSNQDHERTDSRRPLVVVIPSFGGGMGRMFWQTGEPFDALYDDDALNADGFIAEVQRAGYPNVTVVTNLTGAELPMIGTAPPRKGRWGLRRTESIPGTGFTLLEYGPAGP